jgi:hypothetical protein
MVKGLQQQTVKNIESILNLLREAPPVGIHLRGISNALGLNPFTVSRIVDYYLVPFIEIKEYNEFGVKAKLIRLKAGKEMTIAADVLRYLALKERIKST